MTIQERLDEAQKKQEQLTKSLQDSKVIIQRIQIELIQTMERIRTLEELLAVEKDQKDGTNKS